MHRQRDRQTGKPNYCNSHCASMLRVNYSKTEGVCHKEGGSVSKFLLLTNWASALTYPCQHRGGHTSPCISLDLVHMDIEPLNWRISIAFDVYCMSQPEYGPKM